MARETWPHLAHADRAVFTTTTFGATFSGGLVGSWSRQSKCVLGWMGQRGVAGGHFRSSRNRTYAYATAVVGFQGIQHG